MSDRKVHTLKLGRTTVHIVEPPPMSEEQVEKVLTDLHAAGWAIIDDLVQRYELTSKVVHPARKGCPQKGTRLSG